VSDVVARGVRFHVQRLGRPPREKASRTVVFVHGLVMDNLSSYYFTLANPVARNADVVLYDLRGHGLSERPAHGYGLAEMTADLAEILTRLEIDGPVTLVGNSYGGMLAVAFAVAHRERVAGLCLIDAHLAGGGWADTMAQTLELQGDERDQKIAASFQSWLGRHSERKRTRLAKTAEALVHSTSLIDDIRRSHAISDSDLRALTCPVLALYGDRSDLRAEGERLRQLVPACDLRILAGCTHSILWEATESVRSQLVAWLAEAH